MSKALRSLGLSGSGTPPKEVVKNVVSANTLDYHTYDSFWRGLVGKSSTTTRFLAEIITKLIEVEEGTKKLTRLGVDIERVRHALCHTIHYLDLFYEFDCNTQIFKKAFRRYDTHRKSASGKGGGAGGGAVADQIIHDLKRRHVEHSDMVQQLVIECSFVDLNTTSLFGFGSQQTARQKEYSVIGDFSFVFHHLKSASSKGGGQVYRSVFDSMFKLLRAIPNQLRANPSLTKSLLSNVMSLMHMLIDFMTEYPIADIAFIRDVALPAIKPFCTWPKLYADIASEIVSLLNKEARSPGAAHRELVCEENPLLTAQACRLPPEISEKESLVEWARTQRTSYVWYNREVPRSVMLTHICKKCATLPDKDTMISRTNASVAQLLTSLLETNVQLPEGVRDLSRELNLSAHPPSRVRRWYVEALDIVEKGQRAGGEGDVDREALVGVLEKINATIGRQARPRSIKVEAPRMEKWTHAPPQIPVRLFEYRAFTGGDRHKRGFKSGAVGGQKLYLWPSVHREAETSKERKNYLNYADAYNKLKRDVASAVSPHGNLTHGGQKPIVSLLVLGGNEVVHRLLCSLVALHWNQKALCDQVVFKIYMAPVGKNDLAAFIASRDGWYRRQAFSPLCTPLLMCPQLKSGTFVIARGTSKSSIVSELEAFPERTLDCAPAYLQGKLIQDLLRGARRRLDVGVFECQVYTDPGCMDDEDPGPPDCTIPFCMRVELGLNCSVAQFALDNEDLFADDMMPMVKEKKGKIRIDNSVKDGLSSSPKWEDVIQNKSFQKSGLGPTPEIRVSMFPMDVDGTLHSSDVDMIELPEAAHLSVIVGCCPSFGIPSTTNEHKVCEVASVPLGTAANPLYPWLELYSVDMKRQAPDLLKKKDKKARDVEALQDALRGETQQYHVGLVDIRTSTAGRRPFNILVDGELYGPFYRIRIKKCDPFAHMPTMSFFPPDM